ncbi:hypothetical protein BCF59_0473 [Mycoplasmopsis mustelae]|uniref:Rho termination factor N-terminal domain-containing protein n=1 Tax=Mycoplasmopsis mustelae TaxID=171289 RepID=A0A4V3FP07_9BACT|nr:hypothetical protein [Mycoplasmopsis mustelae]TDV24500.1 hypothetical protein BCF59_0473 [Mycoplasmopsis mustelae]
MINWRNLNWDEIDNTETLWQKFKKQSNLWIIFYIIVIGLVAAISLIQVIYVAVDKAGYFDLQTEIYKKIAESNSNFPTGNISEYVQSDFIRNLTTNSFLTIFLFTLVVFFVISVFKAFKNRNFKYLNGLALMGMWFTAIYNIIVFFINIRNFFGFQGFSDYNVAIMMVVTNVILAVLYLLIIFFPGREVSKLRKMFIYFEGYVLRNRVIEENLKNMKMSGNFQEIFAPFFGANAQGANQTTTSSNTQTSEKPEKSEEYQRLSKLPLSQLHKIAAKLNIYGHEDIEKDELIEKIIQYSKK